MQPPCVVIVGSDLPGLTAAYELGRRGCAVTLIEESPAVAPGLGTFQWRGAALDLACRLWATCDSRQADAWLELLGGEAAPAVPRVASQLNGIQTEGTLLPDLTALGDSVTRDVVYELAAAASRLGDGGADSLFDAAAHRFGVTAAELLSRAVRKLVGIDAGELAPSSSAAAPLDRLLCAPASVARVLAHCPELTGRVALPGRSPESALVLGAGAGRALVERFEQEIVRNGGTIITGRAIDTVRDRDVGVVIGLDNGDAVLGDELVWTTGLRALDRAFGERFGVADAVEDVATVLHYFEVVPDQLGRLDFVVDYDAADTLVRGAIVAPADAEDGRRFVCCEAVGTLEHLDHPDDFAERLWRDARRARLVSGGTPLGHAAVVVPDGLRVPLRGYERRVGPLRAHFETLPRLTVVGDEPVDAIATASLALDAAEMLAPMVGRTESVA